MELFHKLVNVAFLDGTLLEATFHDGKVIHYDMASLFGKYPQLCALEDPSLFKSGKMMGAYGVIWTDELDIEAETIYEDGEIVETNLLPEYKGYRGTVEYSVADGCLYGKIAGISALVDYEGQSVDEIKQAFREAVDDYLNLCAAENINPNK